jgi:hypothetical protein
MKNILGTNYHQSKHLFWCRGLFPDFWIGNIINRDFIRKGSTLSKLNISLENDFAEIFNKLENINIDKEELNNIEEVLNIIGRLLGISKYGITRKGNSVLLSSLRSELRSIGLAKRDIDKIISSILMWSKSDLIFEVNKDNLKVKLNGIDEDFVLKLIEISSRRKVILNNNDISELMVIINRISFYNDEDLNKIIIDKMNKLMLLFEKIVNSTKREFYKKRKLVVRDMSVERYTKDLNDELKFFNKRSKLDTIKYFMNKLDDISELLPSKFVVVRSIISERYNKNIDKLTSPVYSLQYDRKSMDNVNIIRELEVEKFKKDVKLDSITKLELIGELINDKGINLIESSNGKKMYIDRINKFDSDFINPLSNIIYNILNDNKLTLNEKQLAIEKTSLNYDLNWLNMEGLNKVSVKNIILHDIFNKINKGLINVISQYKKNNYRELKKVLNKKDFIENSEGKCILVILLLGNKNVINSCFKLITDILSETRNNKQSGRTNIMFKVADRLLKLVKIGLSRIEKERTDKDKDKDNNLNIIDLENKDVKNIFKMWNYEQIQSVINDFNEIDKSVLGDSMIRLILKNTNVITEIYSKSNGKTNIYLAMSDDLLHKVSISSLNVTQLPMVTVPRSPDGGKYLPYILPEISHIYNPFDTIIKNKYDNKFNTEGQENIFDTINYLNQIKFRINIDVLKYLVEEWKNKESKLFKGLNIYKEIDKDLKKKDKLEIVSHNSKHWNMKNIINLAMLYSNTSFYLPTFADFRGRMYPLCHYLSYQGSDISRSLLMFDPTYHEELNEKGLDYLKVYLANLIGISDKTWNEKIIWVSENLKGIVKMFKGDKDKFYNEYVNKVKEPFQFISILMGFIKILRDRDNKIKCIINNPILFDASCSGIQHLSAMTRDVEMARKVNIIPEKELDNADKMIILDKSKAQDFYQYATTLIQLNLDTSSSDNLKNIKLTRNMIKLSVMTIPYNISLIGLSEQLKELFNLSKWDEKYFYNLDAIHTKNNELIFLTPSEFNNFVKIVYKSLTQIPSLNKLTKYLNSLLVILLKLEQPIIWITPSGLKISLSTMVYTSELTKSKLVSSSKPVTIRLPQNKLDKMAIKRSFMPNLIHSLDASNIHLLTPKLTSEPLYTVHDCFATTPNNMESLENFVKEAFIEIYFRDGNYLESMHKNLVEQIKTHSKDYFVSNNGEEKIIINDEEFTIPKLPSEFISSEHNKLFINGLLKSKYFIS